MSTEWSQSQFATSLFGPAATAQFVSIAVSAESLIYWALRILGVLRPGQVASPEVLADGLMVLNDMMDGWNAERLMAFAIIRREFPVSVGVQDYAIGIGQVWNYPRPERVEGASMLLQSGSQWIEYPMYPLDSQGWQLLAAKQVSTQLPSQYWYEPSFPNGTMRLYPVPSVGGSVKAALYLWQQLGLFADLSTTHYAFPPGYARAIRYNLAEALMPAFNVLNKTDRQQWGRVIDQAAEYRGRIKALNASSPEMRVDDALRCGTGAWDWRTGDYRR